MTKYTIKATATARNQPTFTLTAKIEAETPEAAERVVRNYIRTNEPRAKKITIKFEE